MKAKLIRVGCGLLIAALLAVAAGCGSGSKGIEETTLPEQFVTEAAEIAALDEAGTVSEEELSTQMADETTVTEITTAPAESKTTTKAAEMTKSGESKTTVRSVETTTQKPPVTATSAPKANDGLSDWAAAYQKYLLNVIADRGYEGSSTFLRFGLFYLNDDSIPELWFTDGIGAHGPSYVIVTYRNGKAETVFEDGNNNLEYYEKTGVFYIWGSGGYATGGGSYYKMTGSSYTTLDEYEYDAFNRSDNLGVWTLNGKEETIAADQFNEKIDKLHAQYDARYSKKATVINENSGYPLTSDSIKKNCK